MSYKELRTKRREAILEGISKDSNLEDIAEKIGSTRRQVIRDVKYMRKRRDPGLLRAQEKALKKAAREKKAEQVVQNKAFVELTGMTLKEKSFRNMVDYYRPELTKILDSKDKKLAIGRLPKSVRRTMIKNGIVKLREGSISKKARKRLARK